MRYAMPQANFYTNGRNLNQLNQVFAAGHNLALSYHWLPNADYIRNLVQIRQQNADTLIYGEQAYQPMTENEDVAAYVYRDANSEILTVVNTSVTPYTGTLTLQPHDAATTWLDLLSGEQFTIPEAQADEIQLSITLPPTSLRILRREH